MYSLQKEKGFTLVEIMIVVAIIALLAAIAIPNVLRGRATANESAAVGNTRALVNGLEMYRATNNEYPATWQDPMYTDAEPDYGPPSFDLDLDTGDNIQGYEYLYAQGSATTYDLDIYPSGTSDGTKAFHVDESGTVRHCRCPADGCDATTNAADDDPTLEALPTECA